MRLEFLFGSINIFLSGLALLGVWRTARGSMGHWAGLSVLVTLPLANLALLVFTISGIPYFRLDSAAGIMLLVTSGTAVAGALTAGISGWRARKMPNPRSHATG